MLKRRDVDDALVQADYMSGDRNTIASALLVHNRLGVVVLTGKGHNKKDEAQDAATAAKNIDDRSTYFSSDEYIARIGADKPLNLMD